MEIFAAILMVLGMFGLLMGAGLLYAVWSIANATSELAEQAILSNKLKQALMEEARQQPKYMMIPRGMLDPNGQILPVPTAKVAGKPGDGSYL